LGKKISVKIYLEMIERVWSKNTIFAVYLQLKIPKNSDFAKKRDLITVPNGKVAADIAKMFAKKFCENRFSH
jgi:hypothetical protein